MLFIIFPSFALIWQLFVERGVNGSKKRKKKNLSDYININYIKKMHQKKKKKTNSFFIFKQQLPCYLVSECAITINLHAGKICLGQTMNMTKCEIPQPLSMSHFPGSCWGKAGRIDPLSTAFGRRVAHIFFSSMAIYLHSVSLSRMEAVSL